MADHLIDKSPNNFNLYKTYQLESTSIEIIDSKKVNIIVGCLYKYPVMDVSGLSNINPLLNKLSKETNQVFLLGNLNINL